MTFRDSLLVKADALVKAIAAMPPKERDALPKPDFAEDYNKFRGQVLAEFPGVQAVAPPAVSTRTAGGAVIVKARYAEVSAYYQVLIAFMTAPASPIPS